MLRNDSPARVQEGLVLETRVASGTLDTRLLLRENGAVFVVEPVTGQKTGWFFDQRRNRDFIAALSRGGTRVLDLYCYTGGFSVRAARAGATETLGIDRSQSALALAGEAAALNGIDDIASFRRGEVFAEAERLAAEGKRFDMSWLTRHPLQSHARRHPRRCAAIASSHASRRR